MSPSSKHDLRKVSEVVFDFSGARMVKDLAENLSGVVVQGRHAWTVSDEGRTIECFEAHDHGFRLAHQYGLADFFADLPAGKEADLESIDIADGRVWVCGSHCRVRRKPPDEKHLDPDIRRRRSRHLLGSIRLRGATLAGRGLALPYTGEGSLRPRLQENRFLEPFVDLPSKENGLDIEGLAVLHTRVLLGLRGPVLDGHAVVASLPHRDGEPSLVAKPRLHLLAMAGLGVRDLCRDGAAVLVLAGPVADSDGPFRLFRWHPRNDGTIETPDKLHEWASGPDHPEGVCRIDHHGSPAYLVVYDSPSRRAGAKVTADIFA
jgi:hypothetical protein